MLAALVDTELRGCREGEAEELGREQKARKQPGRAGGERRRSSGSCFPAPWGPQHPSGPSYKPWSWIQCGGQAVGLACTLGSAHSLWRGPLGVRGGCLAVRSWLLQPPQCLQNLPILPDNRAPSGKRWLQSSTWPALQSLTAGFLCRFSPPDPLS